MPIVVRAGSMLAVVLALCAAAFARMRFGIRVPDSVPGPP